jgi:hypothetical protein
MPGNYMPNDETLYETYYCESETLAGLRQVLTRLYSDRPLIGDERRDLANRMDALLGHIDQMPVKDGP